MIRGGGWVVVQVILLIAYAAISCRGIAAWSAQSFLGLTLVAGGVAFFVAGVSALGRSLTPFPRPRPDARLVTGGAFALVRHPIYAGVILAAFGWAIAARLWPSFCVAALIAVFFDAKARFEERALAHRFSDYASYARRVKRLIPGVY